MLHTGDRPYKCDECKLAYKSKQLLTRHRRHYHFSELTSEELTEAQEKENDEEEEGEEEEECAACLKIYERYRFRDTSDGQQKEDEESEGN